MVKIRLARVGRKNDPSFRIVVQDSRKDPFGTKIEVVGFISPRKKEKKLDKARIEYWLKVGAQPSETAHNLLVSEGIIKGKKKINVYHPSKRRKAAAAKAAEEPKAGAPAPAAPTPEAPVAAPPPPTAKAEAPAAEPSPKA